MTTRVTAGARYLLAAVFLYAGATKAFDPAGFATAIGNYRLVPHAFAVAVALYLPWIEIVCGLGLFWARFRAGALLIFAALSAVFMVAIASAITRGLDIECGCFIAGGASRGVGGMPLALFRSIFLVLVASWLLRRELESAELG